MAERDIAPQHARIECGTNIGPAASADCLAASSGATALDALGLMGREPGAPARPRDGVGYALVAEVLYEQGKAAESGRLGRSAAVPRAKPRLC